jgi:hypothetical protein
MAKEDIKFDKKALDEAEKDYNNVFPKGIQSEIIKDLIGITVQSVPISRSAMGGIFIKSIADWQKAAKMELGDLIEMTAEIRIKEVTKIMHLVRDRLIKILALVSQGKEVQKAFEEALNLYEQKYSKR